VRKILLSVVSTLLMVPVIEAQQSTSPPPPPGAQAAFEKGLHAVGENQFGLAIRYFMQAHDLAPTYPPILFNLGVAHDKAGHEVAAIAWLEAYLSAAPKIENAPEVRREIEHLKGEALNKARRVFQVAIKTAQQLNGYQKDSALRSVGWQRQRVGDIEESSNKQASLQEYREAFAELCAQEGFPQVAVDVLQNLSSPDLRDKVWEEIFHTRGYVDDYDGAIEAAGHITDGKKRNEDLASAKKWRLNQTIEMNFEVGNLDHVPLEELLSLELDDSKITDLLDFGVKQIESRDLTGARETINRGVVLANRLQGETWLRAFTFSEVALAQMKLGDSQGAKSSARSLLSLPPEDLTVDYRATAKAILGDYKTALKDIQNIPEQAFNPGKKDHGFGNIALVQALSGNFKAANETARLAAQREEDVLFDKSDASIGRAYLLRGNFADALEHANHVIEYQQQDLLKEIMRTAIRVGKLREAEQAALEDSMIVGRLGMMVEVAQAYHRSGMDAEARRVLASALDQALREKKFLSKVSTQGLIDPLKKIAQTQTALGDENGARQTLNAIPLVLWLAYARMWSGRIWSREDEGGDTEKVLDEVSREDAFGNPVKADQIPGNVAWLGTYLGECVLVADLHDHVYSGSALPFAQ
jgi:tetratricopeptide (TPR) repeat protein